MSEKNKALVRRWTEEIWNQGNLSAIDEIVAAEYVHHDPLMPDLRGIGALRQIRATFHTAFPDGRFTELDLIEEGDKVVMRWTLQGTQRGEWIGVAATDSPVEITGTTTLRLADGKVAEHWAHWDSLGWIKQVGAAAEALTRRFVEEVLNKGNLDVVDEIFAEDAVFGATLIPEVRGPKAIKELATAFRTAFPDVLYSSVGESVVHGDRCAFRWTASGTHRGEFMGIAPTGRYVTYSGTGSVRVRGGKIAEHWADWDALGLMQQLGAAPLMGQVMAAAAH